jgi:hypothetical protein
VKQRLATLALAAWLFVLGAGCPDERAREHERRADSVAPAEASAKAVSSYTREGLEALAGLLREKGGGKPVLLMLDIARTEPWPQLEASGQPGKNHPARVARRSAARRKSPVELGGKGALSQKPLPAVLGGPIGHFPALLTGRRDARRRRQRQG